MKYPRSFGQLFIKIVALLFVRNGVSYKSRADLTTFDYLLRITVYWNWQISFWFRKEFTHWCYTQAAKYPGNLSSAGKLGWRHVLPMRVLSYHSIWGIWYQKQVSKAWISNCITQYAVGWNYLHISKWGIWYQKQVSKAWISYCITQYSVG